MAHIPFAPQFGVPITLAGPYSFQAVFNDPASGNYVGMLTNVSGLDSADVRESADDFVNLDGGVHGNFFYNRRSIVLEGLIENPTSATDRNTRLNRLMRCSANMMRADGSLVWTPDGGSTVIINVRKQARLNIDGAWTKRFQLPLVAADPRIYTFNLNSQTVAPNATAVAENKGSTTTYPTLTITGPITNPVITNQTTNEAIGFTITLTTGQTLILDMLNRTAKQAGVSKYGNLNFGTEIWFGLQPGNNTIRLDRSTSSGAAGLQVQWRDAWV